MFPLRIVRVSIDSLSSPFASRRNPQPFVHLIVALCKGHVVASSPGSLNNPVAHNVRVFSEYFCDVLAPLSPAFHAESRHHASQFCCLPILRPASQSVNVSPEQAADFGKVSFCFECSSHPARTATKFVDMLLTVKRARFTHLYILGQPFRSFWRGGAPPPGPRRRPVRLASPGCRRDRSRPRQTPAVVLAFTTPRTDSTQNI